MKSMHKLRLLLITSLIIACFVGYASASVSSSVTVKLYYDDGSYTTLPAGTYSLLNRTDNIWYVNGAVFPSSTVEPSSSASATPAYSIAAIFGTVYGAIIIAGFIPIALGVGLLFLYLRNPTEENVDPHYTMYMIGGMIAAGIFIVITALIVALIQAAPVFG
jgi:hypothetical protein